VFITGGWSAKPLRFREANPQFDDDNFDEVLLQLLVIF